MKRNLMVFTAITSLLLPLAAPVMAVAQDREGRAGLDRATEDGDVRPDQPGRLSHRRDRSDRAPAEPAQPSRPERASPPDAPARPSRPDQPARADRSDRGPQSSGQRPERNDRPSRPGNLAEGRQERNGDRAPTAQERREDRFGNRQERGVDYRTNDNQDRRDNRADGRRDRRTDNRNDRREDRQEHRRDRREYREFRDRFNSSQWHHNWNRNHRPDWWRSDRRFRSYNGLRIGFYFAPGHGYYSVPRSYWGQRWRVGDYLPSMFWRYQLDDWRTFGLGFPPPGTRWVVVDNQIYLIDQHDGYIVDVIHDAWRW